MMSFLQEETAAASSHKRRKVPWTKEEKQHLRARLDELIATIPGLKAGVMPARRKLQKLDPDLFESLQNLCGKEFKKNWNDMASSLGLQVRKKVGETYHRMATEESREAFESRLQRYCKWYREKADSASKPGRASEEESRRWSTSKSGGAGVMLTQVSKVLCKQWRKKEQPLGRRYIWSQNVLST
jgi:hypothetical protein